MALEAKAMGGDVALEAWGGRVEVPVALVAVTAIFEKWLRIRRIVLQRSSM
jgi:hypothetical protein